MSYPGRQVLAYIAERELDIEFWAQWSDRLHPDEARAIAAGDIGVIKRPIEPAWPVGEWMEVASNLWMRPRKPTFSHKGYRIGFDLRDFRVRLPRRTPQVFDPPDTDEDGYAIPPTLSAIRQATELGNYTGSPALAVPDIDEAVDQETADQFAEDARDRFDFTRKQEHRRRHVTQLSKKLKDVEKKSAMNGVDISDEVQAIEGALEAAQDKVIRSVTPDASAAAG